MDRYNSATNMNCDASLSLTPYNLNGDGWKAGWNGTQVRILRKIDSVVMGTFGTNTILQFKCGGQLVLFRLRILTRTVTVYG